MPEELLRRANDGDQRARNELLESQVSWLREEVSKRLYPSTANAVEVDDVVNTVIAKYLAKPPSKPAQSLQHLQAQLLIMIQRALADAGRDVNRSRPFSVPLTGNEKHRTEKPLDGLIRSEQYQVLQDGLAGHDPEHVRQLREHHEDELAVREISRRSGKPASTVGYQIKRLRDHLKDNLKWYILVLAAILTLSAATWFVYHQLASSTTLSSSPIKIPEKPKEEAKPDKGTLPEVKLLQAAEPKRVVEIQQSKRPAPPNAVFGQVIDHHTGRPIFGARIDLQLWLRAGGSQNIVRETDTNGFFSFEDVPDTGRPAILYVRGDGIALNVLEVKSQAEGYVIKARPESRLHVEVVDSRDRSVPNVIISIDGDRRIPHAGTRLADLRWEGSFRTRKVFSDQDGKHTFFGLYEGTYVVTAENPDDLAQGVKSVHVGEGQDVDVYLVLPE